MEYREIGRTGLRASVVGLGAEHLDNKPPETVAETIDAAFDHGMNIMDVFMPGAAVRGHIGRALAGRRERMIIQGHIGSTDVSEQYDRSRDLAVCQRFFEDLLRLLQTDYIDLGMLFFLDDNESIDAVLNNGILDYARRLKERGVIRAIGASVHNPAAAKRLVEEGLVEMLMFSINPAFDCMPGAGDIAGMLGQASAAWVSHACPERAALYRLCGERGVGITAMKSLAAGKLLSAEQTPFAVPLTPTQCIHYALTRPAVASALVGCQSRAQVEAAARYALASADERDYTGVISQFREDGKGGFAGQCLYCSHCLPCPAQIDVAAVHKCFDMARAAGGGVSPGAAGHYAALRVRADACLACGDCEGRCPFGVPVIDNMKKAAALFAGHGDFRVAHA